MTSLVSGDVMLDPLTRRVVVGGRPVRMSSLSFETLRVLIEASPAPVSCQLLIDRAWDGAVVADETVSQRIRLLRKALGDDGRSPRYIESVRGHGYRWIGAGSDAARQRHRHRIMPALPIAAVLLGAGGWLLWPDPPPGPPPANAPTAADYTQQGWVYLARHQREDNQLAQSLFRQALNQSPGDPEASAGLSLALSQSVAKFNASPKRAIQAESLAQAAIRVRPQDAVARQALAASLDARGRIEPAMAAYRSALDRAPDDPALQASLSYLLLVRGELAESLRLSLAAARRAPDLPYVGLQIAEALRLLGFSDAAEPWLRRADELRPDSVFAAETRARLLLVEGRYEQAATVVGNAIERGVQRPELHEMVAMLALIDDQPPAAMRALRQALSVDPEHGPSRSRLTMLAHPGAAAAERTSIEHAIAAGDTWPGNYLLLAELAVAAGETAAALDALERLRIAGFRDHQLLRIWPTLAPLRSVPEFDAVLAAMQVAAEQERDRVMAADWAPPELVGH